MRAKPLAGVLLLFMCCWAAPSESATTYVYDSLGRVWIVNYDNGMQITYSYDAAGNRTQVVTQSGSGAPPQANNDWITVYGTTPYAFDPTANDTDPNSYALQVTEVGAAPHGTATAASPPTTPPSVNYSAKPSYVGTDSFTYTVSNGHGQNAQATVFVNVQPVNTPIANPYTANTPQNTPTTLNPLSVDSDPLGFPLIVQSVGATSNASVTINGGTTLTYTPTSSFRGKDAFDYTISDGHGQSATSNITVYVGIPPTAVADIKKTPVNTAVTYDPRANDSDAYSYPFTVTSVSAPVHNGTVVINSGTSVTYTPANAFTGVDTFNYTITDSHGLLATAADSVCVGYSGPTAVDDTVKILNRIYHTDTELSINFDPRGNDTYCVTNPTITVVTQPSAGTVRVQSDGSLTYTYYEHINGQTTPIDAQDSFTYKITDIFGSTSTTATVSVNINAEYDPLE